MINILIGNKSNTEANTFSNILTNDKNYTIKNTFTGIDTLSFYWKISPDILILDSNLPDMSIIDILNRLSASPVEQKKCNTILILPHDFNIRLSNVAKLNKIIYKPIINNILIDTIKNMSTDYHTPDLENGEIDWLLQSLNFNCMSTGYRYMKDAITYCYYRPNELEFLNNIIKYLAYKYNVPESRVRDSLKSSIRPFNNSFMPNSYNDLYTILYNNGNTLSLKDFLERIVFYLIKTKRK